MRNDKDLNALEINTQANNSMYVNNDHTDKLLSQEEYEYNLISNAILEFESELNDDEEPVGYTLEEFTKMVKKAVWNID